MLWSTLVSGLVVSVFLGAMCEPIAMVAMTGAASSLRLDDEPTELRGLDAFGVLGWLVATCALPLVLGLVGAYLHWPPPFLVATLVAATLALGCRVRVRRTDGAWRLERYFLFVVRWRTVRLERPVAHVDGWGDFLDPEAFHIADDARPDVTFELAWGSRNGPDLDALAERFNERVAKG